MALRVIELITPKSDKNQIVQSLDKHRPDEGYVYWISTLEDDATLSFRIVLDMEESEDVMDKLQALVSWREAYRIVVYAAEATLPRLNPGPEVEDRDKEAEKRGNEKKRSGRMSREELYADVFDTSQLTRNFILLVVFSSLIAVIGLWRDNVAIIIGAMVLAPFLGPNVALSLATTLGDTPLAKQSLRTLAAGVGINLAIAIPFGMILPLTEYSRQLLERSTTTFADMVLAIVSGAAGIISVTMGGPSSIIGVMVALALLPPLTACGMFVGAGDLASASGAALLFLTNVICLNLAGVTTFVIQGIQPLTWYEKNRARAAALRGVIAWAILLGILMAAIAMGRQ